jgi:hypothetical protein
VGDHRVDAAEDRRDLVGHRRDGACHVDERGSLGRRVAVARTVEGHHLEARLDERRHEGT